MSGPPSSTAPPPAPEPSAGVIAIERWTLKVLGEYPHDVRAFTQGLVWDGGILYESTGLYGSSTLRRVDPEGGKVLAQSVLDPNLFGEGLAQVGARLIQLTWNEGLALVYDLGTLQSIDQFGYEGEGWGLTYDGTHLVMSDGSDRLTFRNPNDFRPVSSLSVRLAGRPLAQLNELEFAEGAIYANVLEEDWLVRIDPKSGDVTAQVDASGLLTRQERSRADVLNGIAYDPVSRTFWITGKFWPKLFHVALVPTS